MEVNHQCELAAVLGMFSRFLGLTAARNHPQPSVEDLEGFRTLESQLKAYRYRAELFYMQGEPLREEAAALGVDLDCFSELPPGASQELRDWADESGQLIELADRLKRLQILQRQLRFSDATGSTKTPMPAASSCEAAIPAVRRRYVSSQVGS